MKKQQIHIRAKFIPQDGIIKYYYQNEYIGNSFILSGWGFNQSYVLKKWLSENHKLLNDGRNNQ
jgi:hypothetical protein